MDTKFPHAPTGWSYETAVEVARGEQLELTQDHWDLIKALQEYYERNEGKVGFRELHDALDENFHSKGGVKFLYTLFPNGPVAQGCRLAGLKIPAGAVDKSFGSSF